MSRVCASVKMISMVKIVHKEDVSTIAQTPLWSLLVTVLNSSLGHIVPVTKQRDVEV
jgi:hypothetical protein